MPHGESCVWPFLDRWPGRYLYSPLAPSQQNPASVRECSEIMHMTQNWYHAANHCRGFRFFGFPPYYVRQTKGWPI
jgi:hypothetical protein